jgi:hypothetical protein
VGRDARRQVVDPISGGDRLDGSVFRLGGRLLALLVTIYAVARQALYDLLSRGNAEKDVTWELLGSYREPCRVHPESDVNAYRSANSTTS